MKAGKEHKVPLSARVVEILSNLPREDGMSMSSSGADQLAATHPSTLRIAQRDTSQLNRARFSFVVLLFDKRRALMEAWAYFCSHPDAKGDRVVHGPWSGSA